MVNIGYRRKNIWVSGSHYNIQRLLTSPSLVVELQNLVNELNLGSTLALRLAHNLGVAALVGLDCDMSAAKSNRQQKSGNVISPAPCILTVRKIDHGF